MKEWLIMNIKQQKQIKIFLLEEFGENNGTELFEKQTKMLNTLIENTENKSKNQMKTLVQTILPRIALYKVLLKDISSKDKVYGYMRKYMLDKIAAPKHSSMEKWRQFQDFTLFIAIYFSKLCVQLTCRKVSRNAVKIILMLQ